MIKGSLLTKNLAKKDGSFMPLVMSVPKLCKILKIPKYAGQIENRIGWDIDGPAADHVYINGDKEISLDDTGLFLFADIFMGYVDQDAITEAWKWLKDMNKARRAQYDFNQLIEGMSRSQLRGLIREGRTTAKSEAADMVKRTAKRAYHQMIFKSIPAIWRAKQ